ncbi:MAG TPA: hypothetical protein VE263_15095 [Candidatus Angelobacter sp.]|nr:hypothetical protein [Candidatus Angelobacter sp.]
MPDQPEPPSKSIFKDPSLYTITLIIIVALVVGWIFFSRWWENRAIEKRATQERTQQQRENDRAAVEMMGGKDLAIQNFYAAPGIIRRGETTQLCYGVANAKTVTLEPQSNPVWPSYSRCVDVSPVKTTTYTLTVADASGKTLSQSVEVKVR